MTRIQDWLAAIGPFFIVLMIGLAVGYHFLDPAPPNHFVIATGMEEGDYQAFGKLYKEILEEEGVHLELKPTSGAYQNLNLLTDPESPVDAAFVQDGLGSSDDNPELMSLGSLYYEPLWIFYRGNKAIARLTDLRGRRLAIGQIGSGTEILARRLLKASGVRPTDATFLNIGWKEAMKALRWGEVDVAFFMATPEESLIRDALKDRDLHLLNLDQAEAMTRRFPYLHHLTLPHGTIDLEHNLPANDIELVAPTATLLVRDSLHPALVHLLMKAANELHSFSGIFERKRSFPQTKMIPLPLVLRPSGFINREAVFGREFYHFG